MGIGAKERERLADLKVQHFGDGFSLVGDFQRLAVETAAAACGAGDPCIRQEMHLDLEAAVALAALATSADRVETEAPGSISALLGERQFGK